MKTERGEYSIAWYTGTEWVLLDDFTDDRDSDIPEHQRIENIVEKLSKRNTRLYAIFVNAYIVGSVICSEPQMLFLHGVRYNLNDGGMTPIEVIIDNARYMGI